LIYRHTALVATYSINAVFPLAVATRSVDIARGFKNLGS
jgi:hypothetical protein